MDGEDRYNLILRNEYQDYLYEQDNEEYRNVLLKTNEFNDAFVWDLENLVYLMNKLVI